MTEEQAHEMADAKLQWMKDQMAADGWETRIDEADVKAELRTDENGYLCVKRYFYTDKSPEEVFAWFKPYKNI